MSLPLAQLSCQQCQRRKTKCSKSIPCSACMKAGIDCTAVQRHRLPRGKSGNKRSDVSTLKDRVGNLEAIIARMQSDKQIISVPETTRQKLDSKIQPLDTFVAPAFWSELANAVTDLKEVLESPESTIHTNGDSISEVSHEAALSGELPGSAMGSYRLLFPSQTKHTHESAEIEPESWLIDTYRERVDPIFKVLHWPTAFHAISPTNKSLDPTIKALRLAMCFVATCSILNYEMPNKQLLTERYRHYTEAALASAELLTTNRLETLQAFVIYLAGLRANRANATSWTLLPLAIRIAHAQGIPARIASPADNLLKTETYRRLWSCIRKFDLQCAFDRGTQPLLTSHDLQCIPANLNDEDLSPGLAPVDLGHERRFTEMTFSRVAHVAGVCQRKLTEIGSSGTITSKGWQSQVTVLAEYESYVKQLEKSCAASSPIEKFTIHVAHESLVAMRLLLHRPLHKRGSGYRPPEDSFNVLATATEVLERSQTKRSFADFAKWTWFAWVKWYALAVVLAELCTARGSKADHAWAVAQRSYDDYARIVADSETGLLWKPIAKLMQKVTEARSYMRTTGMKSESDPVQLQQELYQNDAEAMSWLNWDLLTEDIMNTDYDE
ncbi:C6 finger domain transcription factor adaR [Pseudocercospora fuligena]|uniref:C6 finger domain transcription factor adaR n=1 Tax=Pseudocercospora fuligena TaxID=685502 RepID=A0A8H6RME0_9PEZI|nr:C6 finger domain transcription factor adaR [Pseudocercospora fuligena]